MKKVGVSKHVAI